MEKWEDYYKILNVDREATQEEIREAYLKLAKAYHPDSVTGNEHMMKLVGEAYEVLSNVRKRTVYNINWDKKNGYVSNQMSLPGRVSSTAGLAKRDSSSIVPAGSTWLDHYKALNVDRGATQETIKEAYLAVLKNCQNGAFGQNAELSGQIMAFAETAYDVLGDSVKKAKYDEEWDKKNLAKPHKKTVQKVVEKKPFEQVEVQKRSTAPVGTVYKQEVVTRPQVDVEIVKPQKMNLQKRANTGVRLDRELNKEVSTPMEGFFIFGSNKPPRTLVSYINAALLERDKLPYRPGPAATTYHYLQGMYGVFLSDYTFQFAFQSEYIGFLVNTYQLKSCFGKNEMTKDYYREERPWLKSGELFKINGQKGFVIPADRLIPTDLTELYRGDRIVYTHNMMYVKDLITRIILSNPDLLDDYFNKSVNFGGM